MKNNSLHDKSKVTALELRSPESHQWESSSVRERKRGVKVRMHNMGKYKGVVTIQNPKLGEEALSNYPNAETIEAIEESRSGKYAGTVDTSSMDAFMKSMGL